MAIYFYKEEIISQGSEYDNELEDVIYNYFITNNKTIYIYYSDKYDEWIYYEGVASIPESAEEISIQNIEENDLRNMISAIFNKGI